MASAQLDNGKHTTKEATSGHIPHDFRERENYSNPDIDKSRSHLNQKFGCQTGEEARKKLRKRIAECDAMHPPKRIKDDRKTSIEIHIPAPREELDDEELRTFFAKTYEELEKCFGKENVIYGVTHFDEVHVYYDPHDKKEHLSRAGLHVVIVPYTDDMDFVPEKYKSGLNMNNFYRKNLPSVVNTLLDEVCLEEFSFRYVSGEMTKNMETVEQLKASSSRIAKQKKAIEHNHALIMKQVDLFEENKKKISEIEEREKALQAEKDSFEKAKSAWIEEQANLELEFNERKEKLLRAYRAHKARYSVRLKEKYKQMAREMRSELRKQYKEKLDKELKKQVSDVKAYKAWLHKQRVSAVEEALQISDTGSDVQCKYN